MSVDDAALPVLYSWWVPTLGGVLLLLSLAWVLWVLRKPRDRAQVRRDANAPEVRATYGQRVSALLDRFNRGKIDLRGLHLELATIVREFGSERMGQDLTVMSRGEVAAYYPRTGLGPLLARCEQPSFSRDSQAEAETSVRMAQEVIRQW